VPDGPGEDELREALGWNKEAERCYGEGEAPPVLYQQRAELLRRVRQDGAAQHWYEHGRAAGLRTARDHYLAARELATEGRFREAAELLEQPAVHREPRNFWAWFLLGYCYEGLARDADAIGCYSAALTLAPDFYGIYIHRGLAHLRQRRFRPALEDFDR